jgi:hypothetical protein
MITDEILIASEEEDLDLVEEAREEADGCRRFHVPEVVADVAVALDPTGLVLRGMEGGDNICTLDQERRKQGRENMSFQLKTN